MAMIRKYIWVMIFYISISAILYAESDSLIINKNKIKKNKKEVTFTLVAHKKKKGVITLIIHNTTKKSVKLDVRYLSFGMFFNIKDENNNLIPMYSPTALVLTTFNKDYLIEIKAGKKEIEMYNLIDNGISRTENAKFFIIAGTYCGFKDHYHYPPNEKVFNKVVKTNILMIKNPFLNK